MSWTAAQEATLRDGYAMGVRVSELADAVGKSKDTCINKARRMGLKHASARVKGTPPSEEVTKRLGEEKGSLAITSRTRIETAEQALAKAQLSPADWLVRDIEIKSYEQTHKDNEGEAHVTPMWSVSMKLSRKAAWTPSEFRDAILTELRKTPRTKSRAKRPERAGLLCEQSIMDHHFGKLAWRDETGEDYDLKIAERRYMDAARQLNDAARANGSDRIAIVVGNDFYHVDKGTNTTTAGTPQDVDGRWQKAFAYGLRNVRDAINEAREIAPVDVVIVPGNHDEERCYTLGVILEELYRDDTRVVVDNRPVLKKAYEWGKTFLGFYHGHHTRGRDGERRVIDALASQNPQAWARAVWRELHMGHLHHEREDVWKYRASEDIDTVVCRRLPSLSGTDKWHSDHGYRALKAAEAHFYSDESGRVGYCVATPSPLQVAC